MSSLNATSFYSATSLLHPSLHDKPLQYTTTFSYSGWSERTLTAEEIAGCYGFSDLQKSSITLSLCQGLIPLQSLRYFIAELTEIAGSRIHQQFDPQTTPPVLPVQPRSWLPSIQRFLSHAWLDGEKISVSAAKADNASVQMPRYILYIWRSSKTLFTRVRSNLYLTLASMVLPTHFSKAICSTLMFLKRMTLEWSTTALLRA